MGTVGKGRKEGQAAPDARELWSALLRNSPDFICVIDETGRILDLNRAVSIPAADIVGANVFDVTPPDQHPVLHDLLDQVFRRGEPATREISFPEDDGDRWYEGRLVPVTRRGRVVAALSITVDITQRKRAEQELTKRGEQLAEAQSLARLGSWEYDFATGRITWSDVLYEIFGLRRDEFDGTREGFYRLLHPDDVHLARFTRDEAVQKGQPYEFEYRAVRPDGSLRWIHTWAKVVLDGPGRPLRVVGTAQDITERKRADEAIREARDLFSISFHGSPTPRCLITFAEGRFVDVNERFAALFGYLRDDLIGRTTREVHLWANPAEPEAMLARLRAERDISDMEMRLRTRAGEMREVVATLQLVEVGGVLCALAGLMDVTERMRAEARLDHLLRGSPAITYSAVPFGAMTFVSPNVTERLGYRPEEFVGSARFWTDRIHPDDLPLLAAERVRLMDQGQSLFEYRLRDGQGRWRWIRDAVHVVRDEAGLRAELIGCWLDITEHKAAEESARDSRERLQAISRRVLEIQETERRVIARELHDEIGQALTAVKLSVQNARAAHEPPVVARLLEEGAEVVEHALEAVRNLSLDLRPPILDDFGLAAALRWYADRQATLTRLNLNLRVELDDRRLPPQLETACFRVVQEALTNVARHAHAREVAVEVRIEDGALRAVVCDDGRGFDVDAALRGAEEGASLGLLGMHERVSLASGTLQLRSAPGRGTEVRASFPLEEQARGRRASHGPR